MKRGRPRGVFRFSGYWRGAGALAALTLAAAPSHALEVGLYMCHVESASLTTEAGEKSVLAQGPRQFLVSAYNGARPSVLERENSGRVLDYHSEGEAAGKASVDAKLFDSPVTELVTEDGISYQQGKNVIRFGEDGSFRASGRASIEGAGEGAAVYTGSCDKR